MAAHVRSVCVLPKEKHAMNPRSLQKRIPGIRKNIVRSTQHLKCRSEEKFRYIKDVPSYIAARTVLSSKSSLQWPDNYARC